ncbi:IAA-alanine resistance protein 1-like isoform X2 [Hibiscus syriacus]|uniref:IAA-alanine resistance protein 1-like isoform X2 n=1 Tax=Hibiscus syriacus TaxID=106335 RepID=UPI001924DD0A|nr:IAA-alanine resistance protein 1-like isoform X2 [Hibiscus syriacus]
MGFEKTPIFLVVVLVFVSLDLCLGSGYGMSPTHGDHGHHHQCDHGHGHGHDHNHHHSHNYDHGHHQHLQAEEERKKMMLPEDLAEEEDMKLYGFGPYRDDHDHDHPKLSGSVQGKPSKAIVDSLALFGSGVMLGDAFLHQLPHSFGGHSHSHADLVDHDHTHAHSLKDLSVGLSVLAGIVLFLLVEKLVRYVEENSGGTSGWSHGPRHLHHKSNKKLKNAAAAHDNSSQPDISDDSSNVDNASQPEIQKVGFKYLR